MKAVIITEGGREKGFGHVTRCLSVYQAFKERGLVPDFIINGDESIAKLFCEEKYCILDWIDDEKTLCDRINGSDIAIIDSYIADRFLYERIMKMVKLAVYFDDNNRIDYPKGVVVNGGIYAPELKYACSNDKEYLLGTKYIPQRKEFRDIGEKIICENVKNVLVIFGGIKYSDTVYDMIDSIKRRSELNFYVIKPEEKCTSAKKILNLMQVADICISGGGQTLYELARVGVPTIGISFADNQERNLKAWNDRGFLEYAGSQYHDNIVENIVDAIDKLRWRGERLRQSIVGKKYVDGKGSARIVEALLKKLR
ncbi:MAG: UDP-2,4-diacetamido-2,4,6-trideoxy-beta-L-altropyranose hydrolase [Candidatus Omnitrophota bacterium]